MQKIEKLSVMNTDFLRDLATGLLLSFRDYSRYNREDIIKLLCNKLTISEIETVTELFFLCVPPREIASRIKQEDMFVLRKAVECFFANKNFLHEVKIDWRRCDVVFCDRKSVVAIEIKSRNDSIQKAIEQTDFYKSWANEVYLTFDRSHEKFVLKSDLANNGVGLLKYSDGKIYLLRKPVHQKINPYNRLLFMTHRHLTKIAKSIDINCNGTKKEIAKRISENLPPTIVNKLFNEYLGQTNSR